MRRINNVRFTTQRIIEPLLFGFVAVAVLFMRALPISFCHTIRGRAYRRATRYRRTNISIQTCTAHSKRLYYLAESLGSRVQDTVARQ
jgi:hypothetical protein